jgi:hypothetical protein
MSTPQEIARDANDIEKVGQRARTLGNLRKRREDLLKRQGDVVEDLAMLDATIAKVLAEIVTLKTGLLARYEADKEVVRL